MNPEGYFRAIGQLVRRVATDLPPELRHAEPVGQLGTIAGIWQDLDHEFVVVVRLPNGDRDDVEISMFRHYWRFVKNAN